MSYNIKIINMVAGVLLIIAYSIYAMGETAPASDDLKSWAMAMLIFIGISIVVMIVIQILFHIVLAIGITIKEREEDDETVERIITSTVIEDERDKLISLKSAHLGSACVGAGFIVALIVLAFGSSALVALHIAFGSFIIGSIVEGGASIYYYERGVRNE
jgi:hypothetical protein